jgi:hypothetical protein
LGITVIFHRRPAPLGVRDFGGLTPRAQPFKKRLDTQIFREVAKVKTQDH